MERFVTAIIFTLLIAAEPTVKASKTEINPSTLNIKPINSVETSSVDLVYLLHRGHFADRGIRGLSSNCTDYCSKAFISSR